MKLRIICHLAALLVNDYIKTHGHVSVSKKDVQHTSVLFTGTAITVFNTLYLYNYWTNFYQIYIFYALYIHNLTYHIWHKSA